MRDSLTKSSTRFPLHCLPCDDFAYTTVQKQPELEKHMESIA